MATLRALTLTPEWAWAVCFLDKRVENRTWAPPAAMIGETIALHAGSKRPDWPAVELMARLAGWSPVRPWGDFQAADGFRVDRPSAEKFAARCGAIVATVRIAGVREVSDAQAVGWECGPFCWDLADVRVLARPVPCKGALGLWTVPDAIAAEVRR